ncbi:hypothetical protein [Eggerthella timonensis]|uniref:hypothetical protein n=1 Tax=Eggerthella timonensis TaxID=1871008 RepID=UPI0011AF8595|nr:hypothetical protein [Eggerthella timonensis]
MDRLSNSFFSLANSFVGCIGLFLAALFQLGVLPIDALAWCLVIFSVYFAFKVRKNRQILVVAAIITYACYSVASANYINRIPDTVYTTLWQTDFAERGVQALLIFLSVVILFLPRKIFYFGYKSKLFSRSESNTLLVAVLTCALISILVFGFERPDSIGNARGVSSPIYEYSTILFVVAFYFAGQSRSAKGILSFILLLFVMQNLVYGGRIIALQLMLVWFFFFVSHATNTRTLIISAFIALFVFTAVGNMRTSFFVSDFSDVLSSLTSNFTRGLAWDTAYSAWHTSLTFYGFENTPAGNSPLRLFGEWLASIVLGSSAVPESNLPSLTIQYFFHSYGGFLPIYFDYYLGILGVTLIAISISTLISWINKSSDQRARCTNRTTGDFGRLCCLYVAVTVPRWFLYSPSQITRGLLICMAVCAILLWLDKNMSRVLNRSLGNIT